MPETQLQPNQNSLKCLQIYTLENGWQQLLLETSNSLCLKPNSTLVLNQLRLPVLWQTTSKKLLCLLAPHLKMPAARRLDFEIVENPVIEINSESTELTLLFCPGASLFGAIHQLHRWRDLQTLPKSLILIAEAQIHAEIKAPFKLQPSKIYSPIPPLETTASIALLDDWNILARFSNAAWQPGCFQGSLQQLADKIAQQYPDNSVHKIIFQE